MSRIILGFMVLLAAVAMSACGGGGSTDDGKTTGSGQLTDPAAVPTVAPISGEKTFLIRDNVLSAPGGASTSVVGGGTPVAVNRGTYEIKPGDFCGAIAEQLGVTVEALLASNPGVDCTRLMPGTLLRIPPGSSRSTTPAPAATSPAARATSTPAASGGRTQYEIRPGDLCVDIASKFGVTVPALQAANNLNCDNLQVGQSITIP